MPSASWGGREGERERSLRMEHLGVQMTGKRRAVAAQLPPCHAEPVARPSRHPLTRLRYTQGSRKRHTSSWPVSSAMTTTTPVYAYELC